MTIYIIIESAEPQTLSRGRRIVTGDHRILRVTSNSYIAKAYRLLAIVTPHDVQHESRVSCVPVSHTAGDVSYLRKRKFTPRL